MKMCVMVMSLSKAWAANEAFQAFMWLPEAGQLVFSLGKNNSL